MFDAQHGSLRQIRRRLYRDDRPKGSATFMRISYAHHSWTTHFIVFAKRTQFVRFVRASEAEASYAAPRIYPPRARPALAIRRYGKRIGKRPRLRRAGHRCGAGG